MEEDVDSEKLPYVCHLCDFAAPRITGLDRHILTKHNIGIDTLMELMLTKIKSDILNAPKRENQIQNEFRSKYEKCFLMDNMNNMTLKAGRDTPYYSDLIISCAQTKMNAMITFQNILDSAEKANKELLKMINTNEYSALRNTKDFKRAKGLQGDEFNRLKLNSTETQTFASNRKNKYRNICPVVPSESSDFSSDESCETMTTSSAYDNRRRIYCCFLCRYITKYRINYWNHMKKFHRSYIKSNKNGCDCA